MFDLPAYLDRNNERIAQTLRVLLDRSQRGGRLVEAMRYSLMAGGKRLRPNLCLAAAEAVGGNSHDALTAACAVEMIHTYSLIHDDLPAMDDDELRRGKPTCHIAFDEATAILAGDALLTMAFETFTSLPGCPPERCLEIAHIVAVAAGSRGMVQGQMLDMLSQGTALTLEALEHLHSLKTGALIEASLAVGALVGDGNPEQIETLRIYGRRVGLAFQVVDDILNVEGDPAVMGKAAGTDQLRLKNSYPAFLGLEKSRKLAQDLIRQALAAISAFDAKAAPLRAIAGFVVARNK